MKISDIDVSLSIREKKLFAKLEWYYKFDLYFQVFMNLALVFFLLLILKDWANYGINEKSFFFMFLLFTLFFNFMMYKKLTEKKLLQINTHKSNSENYNLILDYSSKNGFVIRKRAANLIVAYLDFGDIGLLNKKENTYVFLLEEGKIYFTIFTERNRVNFPNFFDKGATKKEIENYLTQK